MSDTAPSCATAQLHAGPPLPERLAREMVDRWEQGERPLAEEFLDRHPELWADPQAAFRLVCAEVELRQQQAETDATDLVLERFPRWRPQLELLLGRPGGARPDERPRWCFNRGQMV